MVITNAMTSHINVAIIGAGAAGLYAAALLERSDIGAVVLEARDRIGGRLLSVDVEGGRVDLGATWFWPNEQRITQLITDTDLAPFPQHLAGDMMYQPDESGTRRLDGNQLDQPSGRLPSGMQSIPDFLAGQLTKTAVQLSTIVTAITKHEDALRVTTDQGDWSAEHVILATPPALAMESVDFGDGLGSQIADLARSTPIWMGATVKVVAVYHQPFWRDEGLAGAAFSHVGPMREVHDMSGPEGLPAALFGFCALPAGAPAPTEAEAVDQLVELFGERAGDPTALHIMDWRSEPFTSPSTVERLTNYQTYGHPLFQEPSLGGRLHWASTETSPVAPGHIEGALTAAERAVNAITALRGQP